MSALIIFLLFVGIPVAEIALFIEVGDLIGLWPTLGTIILTALVGTALVRAQGIAVLTRIQSETQQGRLPVGDLISGACLVVAGLLLVTPGFLTDFIGFLLLIPITRALLGTAAVRAMMKRRGSMHFSSTTFHQAGGGFQRPQESGTIDGEYTVVDPDIQRGETADKDTPPITDERNKSP